MAPVTRQWLITRDANEGVEHFAERLEKHLGRPLRLLKRADLFEERIRTAGRRAIDQAHAVGVPVFYMIPGDDHVVKHTPNGQRWFVRLVVEGEDELLGPVD